MDLAANTFFPKAYKRYQTIVICIKKTKPLIFADRLKGLVSRQALLCGVEVSFRFRHC